jgi:hypothetical protein
MHFLDEALSLEVAHIDDLLLLGHAQVGLGILSSCVVRRPFYLTWAVPFFFPSYFLKHVSIGKLCKFVGTLWV